MCEDRDLEGQAAEEEVLKAGVVAVEEAADEGIMVPLVLKGLSIMDL